MSPPSPESIRHAEVERLCNNGQFDRAIELACALLAANPHDRVAELYRLLINVILHGPHDHDHEIDQLRWHVDLSDQERNIIRKIFRICYDVATGEDDNVRASAFQRLLRRLLLKQTLDVSVRAENHRAVWPASEHVMPFDTEITFPPALTPARPKPPLSEAIKQFVKLSIGEKIAALLNKPRAPSSMN